MCVYVCVCSCMYICCPILLSVCQPPRVKCGTSNPYNTNSASDLRKIVIYGSSSKNIQFLLPQTLGLLTLSAYMVHRFLGTSLQLTVRLSPKMLKTTRRYH